MTLDIPDIVRRRAVSRGPAGEAWLTALPGLVRDLAEEWDLELGATLTGGTEGLVVAASLADGLPAVLKLNFPGADPSLGELRALRAGGGRGYAQLYRHDEAREAVLLERLGPQLHELGWPLDAQLQAICATLKLAWRPLADSDGFIDGAGKAKALAEYIETAWRDLDHPCPERTIAAALAFAEARGRAFDPELAVLAHGDAHAWNTLQAPGDGPERFRFVDPDGLFIEPAYDLAIPMREWSQPLLAGDPLALGQARCQRLAELTGLDPEPIWQWGLIERTSTGLACLQLGLDGGEMLAVANAWAGA
ncbi:streptomycin 6-kinase [Caulobacter ginsengisoli]|uniref:Streptomycin 6-kinase n=1 Tax=Caulobacter ginsengisoli TaxID=400775 RepID=A0ABU0IPJ7_9CAUL|nr:aminoglycoside phosphotransferase family protein [Caulobacter ginsengisoli]MDQ0463093.1 streptomycin 6-kinase [Caulobacter ginsengisoli]